MNLTAYTSPRRIVVIADEMPRDAQQRFIGWLKAYGAGWARWVTGGWLIAPIGPHPTVHDITNALGDFAPQMGCFVLEASGDVELNGRLATARLPKVRRWVEENWKLGLGWEGSDAS